MSAVHSYSVAEAARHLKVSLKWIRDLIYAGRLPAEKIEGRWQIPVDGVNARLQHKEGRG